MLPLLIAYGHNSSSCCTCGATLSRCEARQGGELSILCPTFVRGERSPLSPLLSQELKALMQQGVAEVAPYAAYMKSGALENFDQEEEVRM
jgi:hypothetical protein